MEHIVFRFTLLLYAIPSTAGQCVTVDTKIGTIIGEVYRGSYNATPFTVNRFLRIPFAEAPIGERRFQKPAKKAPFRPPQGGVFAPCSLKEMTFLPKMFFLSPLLPAPLNPEKLCFLPKSLKMNDPSPQIHENK